VARTTAEGADSAVQPWNFDETLSPVMTFFSFSPPLCAGTETPVYGVRVQSSGGDAMDTNLAATLSCSCSSKSAFNICVIGCRAPTNVDRARLVPNWLAAPLHGGAPACMCGCRRSHFALVGLHSSGSNSRAFSSVQAHASEAQWLAATNREVYKHLEPKIKNPFSTG
jgi:hypothetical protein